MSNIFSAIITNDINAKDYLESFYVSKNKINSLFDNKRIKINEKNVTPQSIIKKGDVVKIDLSDYEIDNYQPVVFDLTILYEDDYLLVIDKPCGYPIYDDESTSVANFVRYYFNKTGQHHMIRHVHRLDIDTTGCLLYAKDLLIHSFLSHEIENGNVKKKYFALCFGKILHDGEINKPIGRDRHNGKKMIISKTGKNALTLYHPIKSYRNFSLVEIELKTGRTHQIRVHFSSMGHPLVGDALYNSPLKANRIMLHEKSLSFYHPMLMRKVFVNSHLPKEFLDYIEKGKL